MKSHDFESLYRRAGAYCARRETCRGDLEKKFRAAEIEPDLIDRVLDRLEQEKFIDEQRYAHAFVHDRPLLPAGDDSKSATPCDSKGSTSTSSTSPSKKKSTKRPIDKRSENCFPPNSVHSNSIPPTAVPVIWQRRNSPASPLPADLRQRLCFVRSSTSTAYEIRPFIAPAALCCK